MRDDLGTVAEELAVTKPRAAIAVERVSAQRPRLAQWASAWPSALLALTLVALLVTFAPMRPGVTTYLLSAVRARSVQRYDVALALYAEAHSVNAADSRPLCASGDIYTLQKQTQAAIAAYRACAALAPGDGSAWLRLGDALALANNDAGAVSAWRHAGAAGDDRGYYRLAERATNQGQLTDAARWWSAASQHDPYAQGELGLLALSQGNAKTAQACFSIATKADSSFAAQLRAAGVSALAQHPPTTATDELNIGYALFTLGQPMLALAPLQRAVQLAPTNGAARAFYGWTLWLLGHPNLARPQIAAGLRYSPGLPFALYAAGQEAMSEKQFSQALAHFETALEITPKNPVLWSAAGDAALAEADYITAELSYNNAAQFSNDPAYTIALVRFYIDHGLGMDNGDALQVTFAATQRFPKNEALAFLLGRLYQSLGQDTLASYAFETASELDPTDPGPWFYLGQYAAQSGADVTAIIDLRTALALQPTGQYASQARKALSQFADDTL